MHGMRSVVAVVAYVALTAGVAAAAPWDPIWERTVNPDTGSLIVPPLMGAAADADGNVYVTGTVATLDGGTAMTLRKLDPSGTVLWRRRWPSRLDLFPYVLGRDVAVSINGRTVYVGGAQMNDSTEDSAARVWSYTSGGHLRWARLAWPGRRVGSAFVTSVAAGRIGVVVGGHTWGECGPVNGLLARFASDGTRRWHDVFESRARDDVGDEVLDVAVGAGGRIFAVGSHDTAATSCGTDAGTRVSIQARGPAGRIVWTRVLPGIAAREEATTVDAVGEHLFVGGQRGREPRRAWLSRLNDRGRIVWSRTRPATGTRSGVSALSASPWRALYVVGRVGNDTFLRRFTSRGEPVSTRVLDGPRPTAVTTGGGRTLFVTADDTLWRLPA